MSPLVLIAVSNVIGGSTYAVTAHALKGFAPRDLVFLRMAVCAALFAPFLWTGRARLRALGRREWLELAAVGLLGYALPLSLGIYGLGLSSSTSAALLVGIEPISIVLLSWAFLGEGMTAVKAASLVLGLSGALLIAFQGPPSLAGAFTDRLKGDLILALHGACWALYSVIGKAALRRVKPLDFTAASTMIGAAGAMAWAWPGCAPGTWAAAPAASWAAMLYVAALGGFLAVILWNVALVEVEASRVANFIFLQPLVGVILGVLAQGDAFSAWTGAGGVLIVAGMWAATR